MKKEFSLVMRALLFVVIAVSAWFVGIMIGQENAVIILNPNVSSASLRNTVKPVFSIMLDYNNGDIDILDGINMTSKANLWEAMYSAKENGDIRLDQNEDYIANGLQWYSVNEFYNTSNARWYIWLNNEYQSVLPDEIVVKTGDVLYFKYLSYYPR